jgi:hypothetical protein
MNRRFQPTLVVFATGLAVALSLFGDMAMYVILPAQNAVLGYSAVQVGLLLSVNRWIRLVTNQVAQTLIRRWGTHCLPCLSLCRIAAGGGLCRRTVLRHHAAAENGVGSLLVRHPPYRGDDRQRRLEPGQSGTQHGHLYGAGESRFRRRHFCRRLVLRLGRLSAGLPPGLNLIPGRPSGRLRCEWAGNMLSADSGKKPKIRSESSAGIPVEPKIDNIESIGFSLISRGFIVSFVGTGLIMSTLGFMLRERFGASVDIGGISVGVTALTGMLLSTRSLINFVGSPAAGAALDRISHRSACWIGFGVSGAALSAAAIFDTTTVMILMIVIFFIGAMFARLAVESQAAQRGHRSYAALATSTDFGSALGPMLGWLGIELSQSGLVFRVGGALLILAVFLPSRTSGGNPAS